MIVDTRFMHRCIQLASKGRGHTSPNPMVGAVIVHDDKIIGEGYHRKYGEAHAEVNAIASVVNKELLKESTLYVSLEPCSHYGKTPPCAQLIIDFQIPRVVIGTLDPFPKVSGEGLKMLNDAGIETKVGLLEKECQELNREFNTAHTKDRPYIYLKWAQSADGFMDKERTTPEDRPTPISNNYTKILVHKLRAECDAIMVGTNTVITDNPSLTTRLWSGSSPIRIVLDKTLRIRKENNIFDGSVKTLIFTESNSFPTDIKNTEFMYVIFDENLLKNIFKRLKEEGINSLMIEGGSKLLTSIIDLNIWDEASVEVGNVIFGSGIKAPKIEVDTFKEEYWNQSKRLYFKCSQL